MRFRCEQSHLSTMYPIFLRPAVPTARFKSACCRLWQADIIVWWSTTGAASDANKIIRRQKYSSCFRSGYLLPNPRMPVTSFGKWSAEPCSCIHHAHIMKDQWASLGEWYFDYRNICPKSCKVFFRASNWVWLLLLQLGFALSRRTFL